MANNIRTYQRYYSASDVQIIISDTSSQKLLTLDMATGIGFNESAPLQPIYGLNNVLPSFFVRQNSIVTGFLGLAYQNEAYLKRAIQYVNGVESSAVRNTYNSEISTFEALKNAITARDSVEVASGSSIVGAYYPFSLTIILSADSIDGDFQSITLSDCFITGRSLAINSDGENPVSEGFSIICPSIK
jgi:hypothetical protein